MSDSNIAFLKQLNSFKVKSPESNLSEPTDAQTKFIKERIEELRVCISRGDIKLVCRGENEQSLRGKFQKSINSNDPVFDGLFLIGDKAKMFLHDIDDIKHKAGSLNSQVHNVCEMIFDFYSNLHGVNFIDLQFFKTSSNKEDFVSKLSKNTDLIDLYLFGIHTYESGTLLSFVSGTTNIEKTKGYKSDLIIFHWSHKLQDQFTFEKPKLDQYKDSFSDLGLPIITDIFKSEDELAVKGCIFPHYIFGVYDLKKDFFILNPAFYTEFADCSRNRESIGSIDSKETPDLSSCSNWCSDGLPVDQSNFDEFIQGSGYRRYLQLISGTLLSEFNDISTK